MILADKIIDLRKKAGWSQEELAEKLAVTRQSVSKWEGAQSIPDMDKVVQMSRLFGVTTDYLLKDEIEMAEPTVNADDRQPPLRRVTIGEASDYLALRRTAAPKMALATMLLNGGAMIVLKVMLDKHVGAKLQEAMPGKPWLPGILTGTAAVSLFFVSMVYPPTGIYLPGIKYKYLGVFTPNPFHNATYMAARPFAILAFFKYGELLPVYEQKNAVREHKRDYILFAIYLLLATMTKPSFTIVLVGDAGILMLWRMFRSRFRNFVPTVWLGVCFIPTFMDLLYQFRGVFVPQEGQEGGIGFTFGHVWAQYCDNLPLAIGLAIGFPILVLLLNYKELRRDSIYRFSWQVYVMSFLMAFFLYEKGFREMDFNFSWGYMYGIFFAFVGALLVLLRATANADTRKRRIVVAVQWLAYLWHLVCGVYYFWGFLQGAMYY